MVRVHYRSSFLTLTQSPAAIHQRWMSSAPRAILRRKVGGFWTHWRRGLQLFELWSHQIRYVCVFSPTVNVYLSCLQVHMLTRCRIIGDILEYHFLCRNPTFNDPQYTSAIREKILQHLRTWFESFSKYLPPNFCENIGISLEMPALAYYALYIYHCLHILIYGQMDLISMYEDTEWQASSDFLAAGEHAIVCANVSIQSIPHDLIFKLRCIDWLRTP